MPPYTILFGSHGSCSVVPVNYEVCAVMIPTCQMKKLRHQKFSKCPKLTQLVTVYEPIELNSELTHPHNTLSTAPPYESRLCRVLVNPSGLRDWHPVLDTYAVARLLPPNEKCPDSALVCLSPQMCLSPSSSITMFSLSRKTHLLFPLALPDKCFTEQPRHVRSPVNHAPWSSHQTVLAPCDFT